VQVRYLIASEFQVQPEPSDDDRSAVFVVPRMDNELHVGKNIQATIREAKAAENLVAILHRYIK
jgi:hypothetical protein